MMGTGGSDDFHEGRRRPRLQAPRTPHRPLRLSRAAARLAVPLPRSTKRPVRHHELWMRVQEESRLFGLVHDGAWFHVGTPDALAAADFQLDPRNARWLER